MTTNILHSSKSQRHRTPPYILDAVRATFGAGIDLDPASEPEANRIVGANRFLSPEKDGLDGLWPIAANIYLNPPGGRIPGTNRSSMLAWWDKLTAEVKINPHGQAIFAVFSIEALQSSQLRRVSMLDYPVCIARRHVAWIDPETGNPGRRPTHSCAFVYVPGVLDHRDRFATAFSSIGKVISV